MHTLSPPSDRRLTAHSEPPREDAAADPARRRIERRMMREAATLFLEEYPQWLAELADELRRGDAGGVYFLAHRIRGALSHFRLSGVCEQARQVEAAARAGDLEAAARAFAVLESTLLRMAPELAALTRPSVQLPTPTPCV